MNLLFDIGHPAHVHLFRNYIAYLKSKGYNVFVVSRKKDVTEILLDHYNIDHFPITEAAKTKYGMLKELLARNKFIFQLHKKHRFDAAFGTSASIGFLKLKYGVPAYNFNEDDDLVVRLYSYLTYPLATKIINPECIKFRMWKEKRVLYPSFHELAYLHPDNFIPDSTIIKSHGLVPGQYVIIRLSALMAHHDAGMKGISPELLKKIEKSVKGYQIIVSHELKNNNINPWDIHNILAHAKMIISDSQTMTIEGSVLGIPSIRINTFIDKSTVILELEKKYMLSYGFYPDAEKEILSTIKYIVNEQNIERNWSEKRTKLLAEKIDFNNWMINFFRKELAVN